MTATAPAPARRFTLVVLPAIATHEPDRNGGPSATPRHIMTPFHRGGGSSGCSWAPRWMEYCGHE